MRNSAVQPLSVTLVFTSHEPSQLVFTPAPAPVLLPPVLPVEEFSALLKAERDHICLMFVEPGHRADPACLTSLETRVPFLDNDLVDFAQTVPVRLKLSDLEHVIRETLEVAALPAELVDRAPLDRRERGCPREIGDRRLDLARRASQRVRDQRE